LKSKILLQNFHLEDGLGVGDGQTERWYHLL